MQKRISAVGKIKINTVGASTIFEVGDSRQLMPFNYTIAVQREKSIYIQSEFNFSDYQIFARPLLQPVVDEPLRMTRTNGSPNIVVKDINVFITSSSSIAHIGSSEELTAQSRIKHVRHLLREEPAKPS